MLRNFRKKASQLHFHALIGPLVSSCCSSFAGANNFQQTELAIFAQFYVTRERERKYKEVFLLRKYLQLKYLEAKPIFRLTVKSAGYYYSISAGYAPDECFFYSLDILISTGWLIIFSSIGYPMDICRMSAWTECRFCLLEDKHIVRREANDK